jgi:pseudouridine synthase
MPVILQKIIAASGYVSRRKAEELIRAGRVKVNDATAAPGDQAEAGRDKITVSGHLIGEAAPKIYIKLNKPLGYTCTNKRFPGEKNIFDLVDVPERLFAVGRLDKASRGLILLTNDGDLTQRLAHPRFEHDKVYEVRISGEIKNSGLICERLMRGINIGEDDGVARAKNAQYLQNSTFIIALNEGKKRQIRRMFGALDLSVLDLKRIRLAGLEIGGLKEGRWTYLTKEEINKLKI